MKRIEQQIALIVGCGLAMIGSAWSSDIWTAFAPVALLALAALVGNGLYHLGELARVQREARRRGRPSGPSRPNGTTGKLTREAA
jgi:hypothetical protein